jgi:hypothetical protein
VVCRAVGSKDAGPRVAAIISIVETCRRLSLPISDYLASVLPSLADFPRNRVRRTHAQRMGRPELPRKSSKPGNNVVVRRLQLARSLRSKSSTSTGAASSAATCPRWQASLRFNRSTSWVASGSALGKFRNEAITSQRNQDAVLSEYTRNGSVTPVCCKGLTRCETFRFRDVSGGNPAT